MAQVRSQITKRGCLRLKQQLLEEGQTVSPHLTFNSSRLVMTLLYTLHDTFMPSQANMNSDHICDGTPESERHL